MQEADHLSRTWAIVIAILLFMIGLSAGMQKERIIQSSEVEAIIRAGEPAEFEDCTIIGNLNLSRLEIERPVRFNRTIFQNSVKFYSSTFNSTAYFRFSNFNSTADFRFSNFNSTADFSNSNFNSTAGFANSNFKGDADFSNSNFNSYAIFGNSNFNSYAIFSNSNFRDDADFRFSNFNSYAIFSNSNFNSYADFSNSNFRDDADFRFSNFRGDADFKFSKFSSYADFSNSNFRDDADFMDAIFSKDAQFNDVQFTGFTSYNSSRFMEDAYFDNAIFMNKLGLTRTRYDKLYIRWNSIYEGLIYDKLAYQNILRNFGNLGYLDDYGDCYIEYRRESRNQPWIYMKSSADELSRKFFDLLLDYFYGYGFRPFYPLYWSVNLVIVFGIVWRTVGLGTTSYGIMEKYGPIEKRSPTKRSQQANIEKEVNLFLAAIMFSGNLFFSGSTLSTIVKSPRTPKLYGISDTWVNRIYNAEKAIGLIFSLYLSVFLTKLISLTFSGS